MTQISRRSNRSTRKTSSHGDNQGHKHNDGIPHPKTRNFGRTKSGCCRITSIMLFVALVILLTIALYTNMYLVNPLKKLVKPQAVTPLAAPKLMDLPMFAGEHKESLYWGTYRPHLYFGVRARTPQSLLAGLMWIGVKDGRYSMRHVCENSDDLKTYGWTHHNGRDYGRQVLVDQEFTLTTSFLKSKDKNSGYGGDWAVRIEARSEILHEESPQVVHLFFYMADESGIDLSLGGATSDNTDHHLLAFGSRSDVGDWELHLESKDDFEFHYAGFMTRHFHNLSDLVQVNLGTQINKLGRLQLSDSSDRAPNVLVFQISALTPFRADIAFVSKGSNSETEERAKRLSGESLSGLLEQKLKDFDDKFQSCFNMSDELAPQANTVAKAALGNLLGGIGYFYGQSKISMPLVPNLEPVDNYILYWSAELYTAVPSRPFFPRGFLWDEGFHQLLIWRWDVQISLDIIGHWLDLMNADGWIPREQILGAEALSKVPPEFVLQHPTNGNPPTLFLVLRDLVSGLKKNKFTASERNDISIFLRQAFVRLDAWFQWFNTTQAGKVTNTYFWHGRDNSTIRELNPKSLSSGLDDYPRASHPSEDERHVDLRCWMHLAAECMSSIADVLDDNHIGKEYRLKAKALSDFQLLNQMHLDSSSGVYFDYGNHTEKVQLSWRLVEAPGNYPKRELVREVQEEPVLRLVPHDGYVSLFPFMERLIPFDSWILEKQLVLISNASALWTKYGVRSLSRTSSLYMQRNTEHDPPYWRGPIWMNMNYMILSALNYYAKVDGPYRDQAKVIYNDLRNNLIRNVVKSYNQTGFLWEQYDQGNGKGKGTRPFTGWTSLIVLIMAQAYHD